jgi:hypothetical protein
MFWTSFEGVPSQDQPFACNNGSKLVPPSEDERVRLGYNHFHCFITAPVEALRVQMELDNITGAQVAAILCVMCAHSAVFAAVSVDCSLCLVQVGETLLLCGWVGGWVGGRTGGACVRASDPHCKRAYKLALCGMANPRYSPPDFYRHANCTGFQFGDYVFKGGCVPLPEHMGDFEDFVRMLLAEYGPLLRHLVVWNEVASAAWMDCSPVVPNQWNPDGSSPLTPPQLAYWVAQYAALLRATAAAVRSLNRTDSTMVYTSNDRIWDAPAPPAHPTPADRLHVGGKDFNDLLWEMLFPSNSTRGSSSTNNSHRHSSSGGGGSSSSSNANHNHNHNSTDVTHADPDQLVWSMAVHPYDSGNPMDATDFDAPPRAYTFASLDGVDDYVVGQLQVHTSSRVIRVSHG